MIVHVIFSALQSWEESRILAKKNFMGLDLHEFYFKITLSEQ